MIKLFPVLLLLLPFFSYSLPGFNPLIKDMSGDYVYYKDTSFKRPSYFGIMCYNDSTYEGRYYSPSQGKDEEIDIKIYFTVDPTSSYLNMTGEKVQGYSVENTEILNYMHDMLYELSARRIKIGDLTPEKVNCKGDFLHSGLSNQEDFRQFGGDVTVYYDYLIPLFNIKNISNDSNRQVFYAITMGRVSLDNNSFDDFKGIEEVRQNHVFKKDKKALSEIYSDDGQTIALDNMWKKTMDNLWMCGDAAVISMGTMPTESEMDTLSPFILRQLLMSASNSYINLSSSDLIISQNQCNLNVLFYENKSETVSRNFKVLTKKDKGGYYFYTMTVFNDIYDKNRKYFDTINRSYTIN